MRDLSAFYFPSVGKHYVPIYKNGTSAISVALGQARLAKEIYNSQRIHEAPGPRVVMFRNPVDRIESAYRFFYVREKTPLALLHPAKTPFDQWVEWICGQLDEDRNKHVCTQVALATVGMTPGRLPAIIVRWDFAEFAQEFGLSTIKPENQSEADIPTVWSDRARQAHAEAFTEDFKVWHGD
jgi:hypothetical protein